MREFRRQQRLLQLQVNAALTIEPQCRSWHQLLAEAQHRRSQPLFGRTLGEWQRDDRELLGLDRSEMIIATGHQTLLWHPGILVKYLAMHAFAQQAEIASANLIVDQHADGFGDFEIPVRRADGALAVRRIELTTPRAGVPMGLHESFDPPPLPARLNGACDDVERGTYAIVEAVRRHRHSANAAQQMAMALAELMAPWVARVPNVMASALLHTSLARVILEHFAADPQHGARVYNDAVRSLPEAGIAPLLVRDDYVEVPLWRIRSDGTRMRAYDNDIQTWLDGGDITLMPRALFMTALIRLIMCDLFIHGTGGANYDRAMERWITNWLGAQPNPIVVATATLHLPIERDHAAIEPSDIEQLQHAHRHAWHDPAAQRTDARPSEQKRDMLAKIDQHPRNSLARRRAFFAMHAQLEQARSAHQPDLTRRLDELANARRAASDASIATRRDWPFPLYDPEQITQLADAVSQRLNCDSNSSATIR